MTDTTIPSTKKMKVSEINFSLVKKKYLDFLKKQEVLGEPFYDKLGQFKNFYIPICSSINKKYGLKKKTLIVGLSGGQGSGKTTVSEIIKIILKSAFKLNTVIFSIDDFYKTQHQRKKMAKNIHRLFLTRGVPGTHDVNLIKKCFSNLVKKKFKPFLIPKFDKSNDDRHPVSKWTKVKKKPDIIIFEGWCVGAKNQTNQQIKKPINDLEKKYDKRLIWRKKVNFELGSQYRRIFKTINELIFLKVPNFNYVYKWRLLQEEKLKTLSKGKKIMSKNQIKKFIMYYERITRQMIKDLKRSANVVINLDKKHRLNNIKFN